MFGNGVERMPSGKRRARVATVRRGKSSAAGKRATIERRAARVLKYGGAR